MIELLVATSPLPPALIEAMEPDRVERESEIWADLTASQRARAVARLEALKQWQGGNGSVDITGAARLADVSASRFYRIASEWRNNPSLAALGVFARSGARMRKPKVSPEVVNRLSAAARKAILLWGDASVSALVDHTLRLARLPPEVLPKTTRLREIVQDERRRINANKAMGQVILFDCVATSLPLEGGRPHIAFLCMDEGTGAILGVAAGTINAVISGYAAAATDALRVMKKHEADWPWSNRFSGARLSVGKEIGDVSKVAHLLNATFVQQHFIFERNPKRYGRSISETVGPRLGRVTFTPSRTSRGDALAANGDMTPWDNGDAYAALRRAADEYNTRILADMKGEERPPSRLFDALGMIAGEFGSIIDH